MSEFDPTRADTHTWVIEGISDAAVAWAESEAARRDLSLAEWVEEAIERAMVSERAAEAAPPPPPKSGPDDPSPA